MLCSLLLLLVPTVQGFSPLDSQGYKFDAVVHQPKILEAPNHDLDTTRRNWLITAAAVVSTAVVSTATALPVWAAAPPPIEGIGGGADIRTPCRRLFLTLLIQTPWRESGSANVS